MLLSLVVRNMAMWAQSTQTLKVAPTSACRAIRWRCGTSSVARWSFMTLTAKSAPATAGIVDYSWRLTNAFCWETSFRTICSEVMTSINMIMTCLFQQSRVRYHCSIVGIVWKHEAYLCVWRGHNLGREKCTCGRLTTCWLRQATNGSCEVIAAMTSTVCVMPGPVEVNYTMLVILLWTCTGICIFVFIVILVFGQAVHLLKSFINDVVYCISDGSSPMRVCTFEQNLEVGQKRICLWHRILKRRLSSRVPSFFTSILGFNTQPFSKCQSNLSKICV